MGRSSHLVQFLWVLSPLLQLAVAAAMVRRRLHHDYPFFFAYSLFRAVTILAMLAMQMLHLYVNNLYGQALLIHETGCIVLRFAVIYELFIRLLKPYSFLTDTAKWFFRLATAALLLFGVALGAQHNWQPSESVINDGVNLLDRSVDIMQCGMLLALLVFTRYLRISWRTFAFGIVVGLGMYGSVALALSAILSDHMKFSAAQWARFGIVVTLIDMIAYIVVVLIWLVYALLPERVDTATGLPEHNLDAWNHELERLLQR